MVKSTVYIHLFELLFLMQMASLQLSSENRKQMPKESPPNFYDIPVTLPFYNGTDASALDDCPRDEIMLANGQCYQLLTKGPCLSTHYVVLDPTTNKGYCTPRLCAPDRIFIFEDQLCHDPRDPLICSEGRQLYQTSYGTPVCQCPEGTYESDDDLEDRGCEPMLTEAASCPPGQVLWFQNFSSPMECLPDPCGGENLRRPPEQHLFVPSAVDGKCYSLGQSTGICPNGTWFSLDIEQLQGICSRLEDAGYLVLDPQEVANLEEFYGPFIPKESNETLLHINSSISTVIGQSAVPGTIFDTERLPSLPMLPSQSQPSPNTPELSPPQQNEDSLQDGRIIGITISRSPMLVGPLRRESVQRDFAPHQSLQTPQSMPVVHFPTSSKHLKHPGINLVRGRLATETRVTGRAPGVFSSRTSKDISAPIAQRFNVTSTDTQFANTIATLLEAMSVHPRWRRSMKYFHQDNHSCRGKKFKDRRRVRRQNLLTHFTPGNIFDTRLVACRAGAKRDINAKCRDTILPSRAPTKPRPAPPLGSPPTDAGRQARSTPPVKPRPLCPPGKVYNIQRLCEPESSVTNNITTINLG